MNSSKQLIKIDLSVLSDYSLPNKCLFPSNCHAIHTFDDLMVHYCPIVVCILHINRNVNGGSKTL